MIDTHCHLNDSDAFPDPGAAIERAIQNDVRRMIVIGTEPAGWESAVELTNRFPAVFAAIGWHPNYTSAFSPASLTRLRALLEHPRVVALGEIGLDYHWSYASREEQFLALHRQLDLASETGRPVVFHAREAYDDLLEVLEARPRIPYLFHCWAGDLAQAERALSLGAMFGVDGPVTYKKSDGLRECLRYIGLDRLVLETDSPYLTPTPHRGKPNEPANIPLINDALAAIFGLDRETCAGRTTRNAEAFFKFAETA